MQDPCTCLLLNPIKTSLGVEILRKSHSGSDVVTTNRTDIKKKTDDKIVDRTAYETKHFTFRDLQSIVCINGICRKNHLDEVISKFDLVRMKCPYETEAIPKSTSPD
jgi:hypothetical protein